jgi:NADH dehydrogenase (ubiquinone) 1 alpha subcomplex subunit 6
MKKFLTSVYLTFIVMDYDIPKSVEQCRVKLREEFEKNRHITDIRVIDMLVIKVCV